MKSFKDFLFESKKIDVEWEDNQGTKFSKSLTKDELAKRLNFLEKEELKMRMNDPATSKEKKFKYNAEAEAIRNALEII